VLQVPIVDLVALVDQLVVDGHLDEEDSEDWASINEAAGKLLFKYYRQREMIAPADPSDFVYGVRYSAAYVNRTGLLQREEPPNDDEPWELIKQAVKRGSEDYLVVCSGNENEESSDVFTEDTEPEDQLGDKLDEADDFADDCEPEAEDLPGESPLVSGLREAFGGNPPLCTH
jgi:hypothetical protein